MKLQPLLHSEDLEKYKGNFPVFPNFLFLCTDFFLKVTIKTICGFFSFLVSIALEKGTCMDFLPSSQLLNQEAVLIGKTTQRR